jgi:CxxC motif-containing protein (DUF1111 family)
MKRSNMLAATLCLSVFAFRTGAAQQPPATEAPTGYQTPTYSTNPGTHSTGNGLTAPDVFGDDQATFEEVDGVDKGLGPVYNARSCADCHQTPVTGGGSQVSEFRVGHNDNRGHFVNPTLTVNNGQTQIASRSLVNDRSVCAEAQATVPTSENIRTFRMSLNTLGDGFIEAIDDKTLLAIAQQQRNQTRGVIAGQAISVPILEASTPTTRIGRFGWKAQHASLLSFSADAYLNEQGITSRLAPTDTTPLCDNVPDPEDVDNDIDHFAAFMRGTLAPPVDSTVMGTTDAQAGKQVFTQVGCAMCHVASITTAPTGTALNGGTFTVPDALGNKIIHPYSDFLLHNIGTGDGIQQNGPPETANKMRTPPLWGLRTRDRLMHDGLSATRENAIMRHGGEASFVTNNFARLNQTQKAQLLKFLSGL